MPEQTGSGGFPKMLFSPPVIIGGVAIGVVLLLMNSGSASAASSGAVGPSSAQLGAVVQNNQIAANSQVALAQVSAQSGAATLSANVQEQGQILSFLENINNNNAAVNNTLITSQAGITNASIASGTAIALDVNNNMTRLTQGYQQEDIAQINALAQVQVAQTQAKAAQNAALFNMIGGIAGGVTKLASTAMGNPMAAMSTPVPF